MVTCFWWFPSSKPSWFAGNWRLCPNKLGLFFQEYRCVGIFASVWILRWGISSLPRNFLTSQDISCSEVTIFGDISFFVCFSSKTLLEVRFLQRLSRSSIFSHGNAFTRNHHFPSKSKSRSGGIPLTHEQVNTMFETCFEEKFYLWAWGNCSFLHPPSNTLMSNIS